MLRQQSQVWGMLASERWIAAQNAIQNGFQHEQTEAHPLDGALMTLRKEGYKDFLWGNISVTGLIEHNHISVLLQPQLKNLKNSRQNNDLHKRSLPSSHKTSNSKGT